jgi:hypothetical protein
VGRESRGEEGGEGVKRRERGEGGNEMKGRR